MSKAQQPVRLHLILLAGGQGARAAAEGQDAPKQFRSVGRRLLCQVALEAFLQVPAD